MKADYIKSIIESYEKSPYECILIDGPWGVGKSYAIAEALRCKNNVYNISMFGINNAQEIYHEVFFQFAMKYQKKSKKIITKIIDVGAVLSGKVAFIKETIESLVKEKELFLNVSKFFNDYHFIVIDDLERMNDSIRLEEVFGIIDELKRCNYVKIILVANTQEISQEECFHKHSEKIIDRVYHITERPEKVDWTKLKIHHDFITAFLSRHHVKNLRTLQKAQNLYDDIRIKLSDNYKDEFYDEIRLACYAIVVETVDNLYYTKPDDNQPDNVSKILQENNNILETRIINHYLLGNRISNNMVEMIQGYYQNEIELSADKIDAEYQIFIHAGEKANYYKSDTELKQILPDLAEKVKQETNIAKIIQYADEYFIWSEYLQLDISPLKNEYKEKLKSMIYEKAKNGDLRYLTYGVGIFHIQSQTSKNIIEEISKAIKIEIIEEYITYLSENTHSKQAYQYSIILKELMNDVFFRDIISANINALYNENSLPIHNVTEQQYYTSYNIMHILYYENKEKFLAYCAEIKSICDNMSAHRIDVILKDFSEEKKL